MRRAWLVFRRVALVVAFVCLLLGVGDRDAAAPQRLPTLDVVIAVDRTTSMSALDDPSGSRITAVRRDLVRLGHDLDTVQFSLVTFGTSTQVALPLTSDRVAFDHAVRALQVESAVAGGGSSTDRAVPALLSALPAANERGGAVPVVVLVTDGEDTAPSQPGSFATIGQLSKVAVVLGYGSIAGGVMPVDRVPVNKTPPPVAAAGPLVPDLTTGQPAVSHRDDTNLRRIAEQLGGAYVVCDGSQDMAAVAAAITTAAYTDLAPGRPQRQLRWLWALAVLLLALPELRLGWRDYLSARRELAT